jgi:hypothetical protein
MTICLFCFEQSWNISRSKLRIQSNRVSLESQLVYISNVVRYRKQQLVFMDEMHNDNHNTNRRYGRHQRGSQARTYGLYLKGKKYSVIGMYVCMFVCLYVCMFVCIQSVMNSSLNVTLCS